MVYVTLRRELFFIKKVCFIDGRDYIIDLYSDNNFIGSRKVYTFAGKYYIKYKNRYAEILDFIDFGVPLVSVDVKELYFRK